LTDCLKILKKEIKLEFKKIKNIKFKQNKI